MSIIEIIRNILEQHCKLTSSRPENPGADCFKSPGRFLVTGNERLWRQSGFWVKRKNVGRFRGVVRKISLVGSTYIACRKCESKSCGKLFVDCVPKQGKLCPIRKIVRGSLQGAKMYQQAIEDQREQRRRKEHVQRNVSDRVCIRAS